MKIILTNGGIMPGVRNRGEMIRHFIMENVGSHQNDIVLLTSNKFKISRQAVNAHLRKLIKQKSIVQEGKTRNISYEEFLNRCANSVRTPAPTITRREASKFHKKLNKI